MNNYADWSSKDLDLIASVKDEVARWRATFSNYLVPYDARVKLDDGEEKWAIDKN